MSTKVRATVLGYVATQPEEKPTQKGTRQVMFSMALGSSRKNADGTYPPTNGWLKVKLFGPKCDFTMQNITKGTRVMLTGSLEASAYARKADGMPMVSLDMMCDSIDIVSKNDSQQGYGQGQGYSQPEQAPEAAQEQGW